MDAQGPALARPYVEKAKVTFPVAVDTANVFGQVFGLKAVPVSFLVDEVGIIRLRGGGPSPEFLGQVEGILREPLAKVRGQLQPLPAALAEVDLERRVAAAPGDWQARLALAERLDAQGRSADALAQCEAAAQAHPSVAAIHFTWGVLLLKAHRQVDALVRLRQARDLDPANWCIRKQIWAIEHPDKFYRAESPDYAWQDEELAREKAR